MTPSALLPRALRATMRECDGMPHYMRSGQVVADLHRDRHLWRGSLTVAVYEAPGAWSPAGDRLSTLWVVAVYPHPDDRRRRVWAHGVVPEGA